MAQLYSSTFSLKISSVELVSLSLYPTWQCQWKTQRQIQMQIHRQIQIQSASKTQFMLYFWRAGGLRISNMTWTLGCPRIGYFQKIGWLEYDRWSPRVAKDQGEPHRDGWDGLKPDRSYLSHFPLWYSKSGHSPIEIPIKNEKWPLNLSYGSIILKIVLWAHFTNSQAVLKGLRD